MTVNPLKFLKRYSNIHCILLGRDGRPSRFETLKQEDEMAKDFPLERAYGPVSAAGIVEDTKGRRWHLFDAETGAPVQFEWGESFTSPFDFLDQRTEEVRRLKLETTPALLFRAFDRSNLANTFSRPTSYILVLMAMVMSAAISWAIAASIYGGY